MTVSLSEGVNNSMLILRVLVTLPHSSPRPPWNQFEMVWVVGCRHSSPQLSSTHTIQSDVTCNVGPGQARPAVTQHYRLHSPHWLTVGSSPLSWSLDVEIGDLDNISMFDIKTDNPIGLIFAVRRCWSVLGGQDFTTEVVRIWHHYLHCYLNITEIFRIQYPSMACPARNYKELIQPTKHQAGSTLQNLRGNGMSGRTLETI